MSDRSSEWYREVCGVGLMCLVYSIKQYVVCSFQHSTTIQEIYLFRSPCSSPESGDQGSSV